MGHLRWVSYMSSLPWYLKLQTHVCTNALHPHPNNIHLYLKVLVTQSCPTLCGPKDCSPPGSFVHGILQARLLERVAIPEAAHPEAARIPGPGPAAPLLPSVRASVRAAAPGRLP